MVKPLQPVLTLRLGDVDFCLIPDGDAEGQQLAFHQEDHEVVWTLTAFSGTLRVTAATGGVPVKESSNNQAASLTSLSRKLDGKRSQVASKAAAELTRPSKKSRNIVGRRSTQLKLSMLPKQEDPSNSSHGNEENNGSNESAPIPMLGQLDVSQSETTSDSSPPATSTAIEERRAQQEKKSPCATKDELQRQSHLASSPSKIQDIMNNAPSNSQATEVWTDECESSFSNFMNELADVEPEASPTATDPPKNPDPLLSLEPSSPGITEASRVSLGSTATTSCPSPCGTKTSHLPTPRWAHTLTEIDNHRLVLYGGQTFGCTSSSPLSFPQTLQDVLVYDPVNQTWFQPYNCEGVPRQWHTSTYIPDRQILISFGGESCTARKSGDGLKVKTLDSVMVLDTEIMLWYPPTLTGDIPSARSGHSATLTSKTSREIVVFGGVKGSKWLNSVYVLDVDRWKWTLAKTQGVSPKPRSYHTATALPDQRIVIFGGNDANASFNSVHLLQQIPVDNTADSVGDKCWRWTNPTCQGTLPSPRTGHSATLLNDQKTICIYGGWDPNAEDDVLRSDDSHMFSSEDCYLLNTETWTWSKGGKLVHADLPPQVQGPNGGTKRVGHSAAMFSNDVLVFGGRVPSDRFAGDFQILTDCEPSA